MEVYTDAGLLSVIERYLVLTWTPASTFGRKSADDPNLVRDMRDGRKFREATAHRVLDYLNEHLALLIATNELMTEADNLCGRAKRAGVDIVNRTVLMPLTPNQASSLIEAEALA